MEEVKINWHDVIPQYRTIKLDKNEVICEGCNGAGLIEQGGYLVSCQKCYGKGKQTVCEYCGKRLEGYRLNCDCETVRNKERTERSKKEWDKWNSKPKITLKEAIEKGYEYIYDETSESFWPVDEVDEWVDEKKLDAKEEGEEYIPRLYTCSKITLHLDADSILENATDELHEDAYDSISDEQFKELQEMMDKWCEKITGTDTYEPDYKYAVILE